MRAVILCSTLQMKKIGQNTADSVAVRGCTGGVRPFGTIRDGGLHETGTAKDLSGAGTHWPSSTRPVRKYIHNVGARNWESPAETDAGEVYSFFSFGGCEVKCVHQ